jgi:hypothetical protein
VASPSPTWRRWDTGSPRRGGWPGRRRAPTKKPPRSSTWRAEAEREGLEPPSPFGRSLSRRVHYHSASAPNSRRRAERITTRPTLMGDRSSEGANSSLGRLHLPGKPVPHGFLAYQNRGARIHAASRPWPRRTTSRAPIPSCASAELLRSIVSAVTSLPLTRQPLPRLGSNLRFSSGGVTISGRFRGNHSIGAPGFEPGTSATRTQRSTGLSHAPVTDGLATDGVGFSSLTLAALHSLRSFRAEPTLRSSAKITWVRTLAPIPTDGVGFEPTRAFAHTISNRAP